MGYRFEATEHWAPVSAMKRGHKSLPRRIQGEMPIEGYSGYSKHVPARDGRGLSPVCQHDDRYWQPPVRDRRKNSEPRFHHDGIFHIKGGYAGRGRADEFGEIQVPWY